MNAQSSISRGGTIQIPAIPPFTRYERVPVDALPSPLGLWRVSSDDDLYELTIGSDGTFELINTRPDSVVWRLTGVWVLDLKNNFINLSDLEMTQWHADGVLDFGLERWRDGVGRAAFAPFDKGIAVSAPWDEDERSDSVPRRVEHWRAHP